MQQLPDDSKDYPALESKPGCCTIDFGCFPIGFVAAFGATFLAIGALGLLPRDARGEALFQLFALLVSGALFIIVAARAAKRNFDLATAVCLILFATGAGGFFGASLVPREHRAHRPSCQNSLKQLGLVSLMYASEHPDGLMPRLSPTPGRLMFENDSGEGLPIYPEYVTDLYILYCPDERSAPVPEELTPELAIDDQAYFYLGYAITNQAELEAFAAAYRAVVAAGGNFAGDLESDSGQTLHRLSRESTPDRAGIPLLIERPLAHIPAGSNVLYADGHVEFIKMNAKWPVTEETMDVLLALDGLGATGGTDTDSQPNYGEGNSTRE